MMRIAFAIEDREENIYENDDIEELTTIFDRMSDIPKLIPQVSVCFFNIHLSVR